MKRYLTDVSKLFVAGLLICCVIGAKSDWWTWRKKVNEHMSLVEETLSDPHKNATEPIPVPPARSLDDVRRERANRKNPRYVAPRSYGGN